MSWPLSRLTTYVASSTPAIKAADLNSIQDTVIGLSLGTSTMKALVLDGTGGLAVAPGGSAIGTSTPTPSTIAGALYKDTVPWAMAHVNDAGTFKRGFNVQSVAHTGSSGVYTIQFINSFSSVNTVSAIVSVCSVSVSSDGHATVTTNGTTNQLVVDTYQGTATAFDWGFVLLVYAT